tara:strand:+ start:1253 stop:1630 length:378 start_codon:yes stop_codon:yes gene_type:complete
MPSAKYYHKNPEFYKEQKKKWNSENKLSIAFYNYHYRNGIYSPLAYKQKYNKSVLVANWRNRKMDTIGYTWEEIYNIYINTKECFYCGVDFTDRKKNLDHDHKTNKIRGILCSSCNRQDVLKNID